jgi:hypothetical protein
MRKIFLAVAVLLQAVGFASRLDRTVGLMLNEAGSFNGYTLFAPLSYTTTYLINNQGKLVHSWESEYLPGLAVYLGNDGYLYRSINTPDCTGVMVKLGGGVEKLDWNGAVVWQYKYVNDKHRAHHDIEVLPNGNVLIIAWEPKDSSESVAAGRNPSFFPPGTLLTEHVIEVEQTGDSSGTIVWEWHVWDHLVQDFDSTKDNFGVVAKHPELINFNCLGEETSPDWIHINAVSYNEAFDQILLTSRFFSEIWVIDHSTTTAQARGHTGGRYGKGGDLLYRWGNPQIYSNGTETDRKLYFPHDGNWILPGLPGAGNILIFNNGGGDERRFSSVDEIVPPVDEDGNYGFTPPTWGPKQAVWTYTAPTPDDFSANNISGAQRLPNGNTLICDGPKGTFFEVTPEGTVVWRYINPVNDSGPVYQGDPIWMNTVFKIRRYPPDYPGLLGKNLTPGGPIEKYPQAVEENETIHRDGLMFSSNPFRHSVNIAYQLGTAGRVQIKMFNVLGQEVKTLLDEAKPAGKYQVRWDGTDNSGHRLSAGVYFCKLESGTTSLQKRIVLVR